MSSVVPNGLPFRIPHGAARATAGAALPPRIDAPIAPGPTTDEALFEHPCSILLVEPCRAESSRLRCELAAAQMQVHTVSDLISALHAVATYQPDLVLSEMRLHTHSGLELIRRLKENCLSGATPVILYSNATSTEQRAQAFNQGATDFLCKPFAGAELIARVRAALKVQHTLTLLEHRARRDSLTGLANRGMFEDQYLREWDACRRQNVRLSVLLVDLDHFKRINDSHGHAAGDEVLRQSAQVLAGAVRRSDLVARYGGEEFVVLAPRCCLAAAIAVAKRFHRELAVRTISSHGCVIPVTASMGIATVDWALDTPETLLRRADSALYRAKMSGRDAIWIHDLSQNSPRVVVASGTPPARL
jgi:diguanylate cyclase (GGDEF)-like protein